MIERFRSLRPQSPDQITPYLTQRNHPAYRAIPGEGPQLIMHVNGGDWPMPYTVFEGPRYFALDKRLKGVAGAVRAHSRHEVRSVVDTENDLKLHRIVVNHWAESDIAPDQIVYLRDERIKGKFMTPAFAAAEGLRRFITNPDRISAAQDRWKEIAAQQAAKRCEEEEALERVWRALSGEGPELIV